LGRVVAGLALGLAHLHSVSGHMVAMHVTLHQVSVVPSRVLTHWKPCFSASAWVGFGLGLGAGSGSGSGLGLGIGLGVG
jgi:hypothetical protein